MPNAPRSVLPLARILHESWELIIRESPLLVPFALSVFTLGQAGLLLGGGLMVRGQGGGVALLLFFASIVMLVMGRIAVGRLVLQPGTSVAEALRHAAARLSFAIWILILTWLLASFIGAIALTLFGVDPAQGPAALSAIGGFALAPAYITLLIILARLYFFYPLLGARNNGISSLKEALKKSRGYTLPLFGLVMLFLLIVQVAQLIGSLLVGLMVWLLTALVGEVSGAFAVVTLGAGMAAAIPTLLASVYAAKLYQHVAAED